MLYGISPFFLSPHLFNSGVFRPKFDEELGLFGDRLFGRFGDKSVDEDVDDLQSRVPEWNDDQDFGTNETAIAEFQWSWIEWRVRSSFHWSVGEGVGEENEPEDDIDEEYAA